VAWQILAVSEQRGRPMIISLKLGTQWPQERFPQGWKELKPYLSIVELP
jgi:hypothetical protein